MKPKNKIRLTIAGLLILSVFLFVFIPTYPDTTEFYKLISDSDRIVVKELKIEGNNLVWVNIFESDDLKVIESFGDSLRLKKQSRFIKMYCACSGTHEIHLFKNKQETIQITNHHDDSIRCNLFEGNVGISSIKKWKVWLDTHLPENEET